MNLYLISQTTNDNYDTYDSAVVAAENEEEARSLNPSGGFMTKEDWEALYTSWCNNPKQVKVMLIGKAIEGATTGVILASFNAG
jgi:hypothetical protein